MAWVTKSSELKYENPWIRVHEDQVTGPSGDGIYGVVQMRNSAVFIIAVDAQQRVCLVTLDRYTVGNSTEVPSGGTDGQDALEAAKRELFEEAGVTAEHWEHIGHMNALNGVVRAYEDVFLATSLSHENADDSQADEGISSVEWASFDEVLRRIRDGEITDGESIAALMFAAIRLGRVN